jgi:hypothetical protein
MHAAQARVNESDNIGVGVEKAKELLNTAKEAFDKKDYSTAIKYAKETIRDAKHSYEDHLYQPIKNCEELIATAQDLGVDVTRANNMLSEAKAALEEEAFSQVALFSQKCKRLIEREITKTLFEKLSQAKTKVNEAKGKGVDIAEAVVLLNIGESSLENKDYVEAASNFHKFEEALEFAETGKKPEPKKKAVEVIREVEKEPVKEEVAEPEMDLGEFYTDLETRINKIHKVGINTKHAEKLLKEGKSLLESDPEKAKEIGMEADSELESAIESRSPNIVSEMDVSIINATEKIFEITLNLNNSGKSVAKDVKFEVRGKDFEVQGLEPLKILKANEKLEIPLKIKALHGGDLKLLINIKFVRIFDGKQIETEISKDINIKEKEKKKIEGPFTKYKAEETVKCYACNGKIKPGFILIHCNCGNTYHDACGGRLGKCPMCGTEFKKKVSAKKKLALRVG